MLTMASIPGCWASEPASSFNSHLLSLKVRQRPRAQQVSVVRCSMQEEFSPTQEKVNFNKKASFNLPIQPKESDGEKETLKDEKDVGRASWSKALQEAKSKVEEQGAGQLALYGGAATLGVILSGALLSSLEPYPLLPETMQLVGVACSVVVASRVIQGRPAKLEVSPIKAVIAIVDKGRGIQRTSLVLPQDLDEGTVATMQRLARERDIAVNQVEEMRRQTSQYYQEKKALETVALQLAEERETAMAEVNALKSTVESMNSRMLGIEARLDREIQLLNSQNQALETVALQLAQERDVAIRETATLKARSEAEKKALEEVAVQLAQERDTALSELADLMNVVAQSRTPTSGS